jgi:hypothetical protein
MIRYLSHFTYVKNEHGLIKKNLFAQNKEQI